MDGFGDREVASEPAWQYGVSQGMELLSVEEEIPALSKVSLWVITQMQAVSNFLGLSFDGIERQAIELFTALEREISLLGSGAKSRGFHQEVQGLKSAFKMGKQHQRWDLKSVGA